MMYAEIKLLATEFFNNLKAKRDGGEGTGTTRSVIKQRQRV